MWLEQNCPWCGESVDGLVSKNYDSNLEAHVTECEAYIAEQGGGEAL